jgi:tetratricopeptide (TPR) repeat protein
VIRHLALGIVLVGATLAVYAQTLRFGFITWDDPLYVTENARVRQGLTWQGVRWAFVTGEFGNWQPLVTLSHMLDIEIYGLDPSGHHATSLVIHLANTLLLFGALATMTQATWASAAVAALFALHPLHVEPVVWISARKDVLSTFFGLLSLCAYVAYARRGGFGRYLATAFCLALGLMAKPMLVTLPCLFLLLDYWPLGRLGDGQPGRCPPRALRWLLVEKLPLLALSAASALVTLGVQQRAGGLETINEIPLTLRLANAAVSYVRYLGKTFWPSRLAVVYPHPNLPGGTPWPAWVVAGSVALLLVLTALALMSRRRYVVVGWLWYLGTLLPAIGLVAFAEEAMADRFSYLPLVGVFIVLVWGGAELVSRSQQALPLVRPVAAAMSVAAAMGLIAGSGIQARYWRNSIALYEHSLAVAPSPPAMHYNLANALDAEGRFEEAVFHYREAVRIQPSYSEAFNNWGGALAMRGRLEEAVELYREALRAKPSNAQAHNNLGRVLESWGRLDEAIEHYRAALSIDPSYVLAHYNLGHTLQTRGDRDEAVAHYREALRLQPGYAPAAAALWAAARAP